MGIGLDVPIHHAERLQHAVLSARESWKQWKQGEERGERAVGSVRLVVFAMVKIGPAAGTALDFLRAAAHVFVSVGKRRKGRVPDHLPLQVVEEFVALHCVVEEKSERVLRFFHGNRYMVGCEVLRCTFGGRWKSCE